MLLLLICAFTYKLNHFYSVLCILVFLFARAPLLIVPSTSIFVPVCSLLCLVLPICAAAFCVSFSMSNRWQERSRVRFVNNHVDNWEHKLVGGFFTGLNKKSFDVRCALSYRWFVIGGFSVSEFGQFYYLIKFEHRHEMLRVLEQGTRVIYGDIFMLHPWNPFLNPETFYLDSENFEIILHNLYPEHTQYLHLKNNTSKIGELIDYHTPNQSHSGYSSMYVKLRINLYMPLVYGTRAPNNNNATNWIAIQYLELPRVLCNYCHRLGHLTEDCIEVFLLTQHRMHSPLPLQLQPHQLFHAPPAPPPSPENNYSEEERYNVDIEASDPDWSLEVHPSPISSGQEQSALSYSDAEQAYRGYNQEGFNSYLATSSETTDSNDFYGWLRNSHAHSGQERERSREVSNDEEDRNMESSIQQPTEHSLQHHQTQQSPINFLTSDIEADFELVSDDSSASTNRTSRHGSKRANPEQQEYL